MLTSKFFRGCYLVKQRSVGHKSLLKSFQINQQFSMSKQFFTTGYPYVFGGMKNVQFKQNVQSRISFQGIFEKNSIQGFQEAYKFILNSLVQKDIPSLQNICQDKIIKNLNLKQNLELLNPDAEIQTTFGKSFLAVGYPFKRDDHYKFNQIYGQNQSYLYVNFNYGQIPLDHQQSLKSRQLGLPLIVGYQILFQSKMKMLHKNRINENTKNTVQMHSIQFQVQGRIKDSKKFMKSIFKNLFKPTNVECAVKDLLNNNFDWKIGDIDRSLKGNITEK